MIKQLAGGVLGRLYRGFAIAEQQETKADYQLLHDNKI